MLGLILLTLRELRAKLVVIGLFLVATFVWLMLTFALNLDIVDGTLAGIRVFGNEQAMEREVQIQDEASGEVRTETFQPFGENPLRNIVVTVQQVVAGITFWTILLLGLFATGTLVTSLLEKGQIDLLLSKPVSRTTILTGRLLGVLAVVGALVLYLLGAVWLVMSIKSGIWNPSFLWAALTVLAMFAVLYSVIAFVSVWTESGALALIVALGVIVGSLVLMTAGASPEATNQISEPWRQVYVGLYHAFPKFPAATAATWDLAGGEAPGSWYPVLSSLGFGAVLYAGSFFLLKRKDF